MVVHLELLVINEELTAGDLASRNVSIWVLALSGEPIRVLIGEFPHSLQGRSTVLRCGVCRLKSYIESVQDLRSPRGGNLGVVDIFHTLFPYSQNKVTCSILTSRLLQTVDMSGRSEGLMLTQVAVKEVERSMEAGDWGSSEILELDEN